MVAAAAASAAAVVTGLFASVVRNIARTVWQNAQQQRKESAANSKWSWLNNSPL
jgi:hypothetical protein